MKPFKHSFLIIVVSVFVCGCSTSSTNRLNPDGLSQYESGAFLTSQDFRSVSQRLARSLVILPQIQSASTPPKIAFLSVENKSNDYVDGEAFLNKIRTELIKNAAGKVIFLDRKNLASVRSEIDDKETGYLTTQSNSSQSTPYGADFFLTGTIESISNVAGRRATQYVRYSFRLTDATTSAIVWEDDYEIKKADVRSIVYSN